MYNILNNKTILILSAWGYPFGGGEEYLYQTAIWQKKYNINSYWISFSNANNKPYEEMEIKEIDGFIMLRLPGGFNINTIKNWVRLINPDLIHHQGHLRKEIFDAISEFNIPFVTGIHFWNGVIDLNTEYRNINIYENYKYHNSNNGFLELYNNSNCIFYSVSKYVCDCIEKVTNIEIDNICYSGSLKSQCQVKYNDPIKNKYVTIINIHKFKGGELILYLLEELKDIPFLLIKTEYMSEELDKLIEEKIKERNSDGKSAECLLIERTNDVKFIYGNTRIFLAPSLVDETFCRTVNEAMMNNIPVITSGQGNLKYLVEDAGIILPLGTDHKTNNIYKEDMIIWKDKLKEIYNNSNQLIEISKRISMKYDEYCEEVCEKMFIDLITNTLFEKKSNNIMIFTPWCDQGLGIQSRNYFKILKNIGYNVHIFSVKPYNSSSAIELQKDPNEWLVENIYYSPNDREKVKDYEILDFIKKYNIGKCLIPETCWFRIFEIAKLLRNNNVKCYAIPNIEIVRKDEIVKHKYFYKILCNNKLCEDIFNLYNINTTEYIGYGIINDKISFKQKLLSNKIKFLFIGGMNAFSRKHILEICEGFTMAYNENENIHLTCTIQKTNVLETDDITKLENFLNHPGITFIQEHLKYEDIIELYYKNDISIQVSKHEGLGLGFYEALSTGTPIITLDTPPHNEIIKDGINGWIIECYYKEMTDNNNSFIKSAYFNPKILCNKILEINSNKENLQYMFRNLIMDYSKRLSYNVFVEKFINSIN